jgi:hypothetical protein
MKFVLVLDTTNQIVFEEIKALFYLEEIPFKIKINVASMFNNFGSYEIYVSSEFENKAKEIIKNAIG